MPRKKGSKNKSKNQKTLDALDAFVKANGFEESEKVFGPTKIYNKIKKQRKPKIHTDKDFEYVEKEEEKPSEHIPIYKARLKILGRTFESEGETIEEVLNGFKNTSWVKGAGVLIIEKDGIVREKIIAGNHIRNLFGMASGTMRSISLKWVKSLFE